jgi:hypothetical protein
LRAPRRNGGCRLKPTDGQPKGFELGNALELHQ